MARRLLILVAIFCVAHGETTHHFRHHGLITQALRERMGLAPEESSSGDEGSNPMMLLPELTKVISQLHERHSQRLARRLNDLNLLNNDQTDNVKKQTAGDENTAADNAFQSVIMMTLDHLLGNLQTVEGGQEAAQWMKTLRNGVSNTNAGHHHENSISIEPTTAKTPPLVIKETTP